MRKGGEAMKPWTRREQEYNNLLLSKYNKL